MSIFGSITTAEALEQATVDTLKAWMQTYLSELERQSGRAPGDLPPPQSYQVLADLEHATEQGPPMVIVVSPGMAEAPRRRNDGSFSARWTINVIVVVPAESRDLARRLAGAYAAAVRWICVQQGALGGIAVASEWRDEEYLVLNPDDRRNIGAGRVELAVEVADVVSAGHGPIVPPGPQDDATAPHEDWPSVTTTGVDLDRLPVSTEEG